MRLTLARSARSVAALVVAVLVVTGLSAVPAAAAAGFTISGHVDLGAVGVSAGAGEVRVAYYLQGNYSLRYRTDLAALTDAAGNYSITGLSAGTYSLYFEYRGTGSFSSQYGQGQATAVTAATFVVAADVSGKNALLNTKAVVSGVVSLGSPGNHPVGSQVVVSWQRSDGFGNWTDYTGNSVRTDVSGAYSLALGLGTYRLRFGPTIVGYQERSWPGTPGSVTEVVVGTASLPNMDVTLPALGSISGHVDLGTAGNSAPANAVKVCLDDPCSPYDWSPRVALTDASGNFVISSVYSGSYALTFVYVAGGTAYQKLSPVAVTVTDSQLASSGTNVVLSDGASISGHVYLGSVATSAAVGEVTVRAFIGQGTQSFVMATAQTDAFGNYTLAGLAAGSYELEFHYSGSSGYSDQWWPNSPSTLHAQSVTVTSTALTGYAVTLPAGASIVGALKDSAGAAVSGVDVIAHRFLPGEYWQPEQDQYIVSSLADGSFSISALPAGEYHLEIEDRNLGGFGRQWYGDVTVGLSEYDPWYPIDLVAGQQATVGDITLLHKAYMQGEVVCDICSSGGVDDGLYVKIFVEGDEGEWLESGSAPFWMYRTGWFSFGPLYPGTYQLRAGFSPANAYASYVSAPIELAEGDDLHGLTITLKKPGTLTVGRIVKSSAGTAMYLVTGPNQLVPLSAETSAADFSGSPVSTVSTSALVPYTIGTELLSNTVVCAATTYFAASGKLWPVTASYVAGLPQTTLDASACSVLPKSALAISGSLFVQSTVGSPSYQIMPDGSKRQVTGSVALNPGMFALKVAPSFLASRPSGPPIQPFTVPPRPVVAYTAPTSSVGAPAPSTATTAQSNPCYSEYAYAVGINILAGAEVVAEPHARLVECLAG